jgi:hypothetical protein
VKTWVDVTLREYAAFQTWRSVGVELDVRRRVSNAAPIQYVNDQIKSISRWGICRECWIIVRTSIINKRIDPLILLLHILKRRLYRLIIFNIDLHRLNARFRARDLGLQRGDCVSGFGERAAAHENSVG